MIVGFLAIIARNAYAQGDLDPTNPPEPYTRYKLATKAVPEGYTYGSGMYLQGSQVNISTSAYSQNYKFLYWTLNGERYSDVQNFTFTMIDDRADFVAVYDYDPVDPQEPIADYTHRLYVTNNMTPACSFNISSGTKVKEDTYIYVRAYVNSGYDFLGWYEAGRLVSDETAFNYLMGTDNVTLEARFSYNPINPDEPNGNQTDVANAELGDVNEDGTVDISDKVMLVNYYLKGQTSELNTAISDINNDSSVDITDAVGIVNNYLNSKK